ncbi:MAG: RsmB/NOP family class I SAM-dependent RNA methyltransferase [Polymorphobacter sp.]
MTPAARIQAAIDCLDQIATAARDGGAAADTLIARYFSTRRYAGSKDRRAVRDLIYDVIRAIGTCPRSGRAAMIGYASAHAPDLLLEFGAEATHAPRALDEDEDAADSSLAPEWLLSRLRVRFGSSTPQEVRALLDRAPLDLRVNRLKTSRAAVLAAIDGTTPCRYAADGVRSAAALAVEQLPAFHDGLIEVQDEGSQLTASACAAPPGSKVLDLCAGAGGKTLALAAQMDNQGHIIASDTDRGRLDRLTQRCERAGASIVESRLLNPYKEASALADLVGTVDLALVDAPCSGSGTWRRNPEARWRLTPQRLDRLVAEQRRLLDIAAATVKPGGALVYVVCSLLPEEAEAQIARFLEHNPDWRPAAFAIATEPAPVSAAVLTPHRHGCDGFFVARLARS